MSETEKVVWEACLDLMQRARSTGDRATEIECLKIMFDLSEDA